MNFVINLTNMKGLMRNAKFNRVTRETGTPLFYRLLTTHLNIFNRKLLFSYILYDVNPPEGFNLRRDVYIRTAIFVRNLVEQEKEFKWKLVLPPWGNSIIF